MNGFGNFFDGQPIEQTVDKPVISDAFMLIWNKSPSTESQKQLTKYLTHSIVKAEGTYTEKWKKNERKPMAWS